MTGLNTPRHRVKDFSDSMPMAISTLLDLPFNDSYWDHPYDSLYKVLRRPLRIPLEKLEEPFIYVKRTSETSKLHRKIVIYGKGIERGIEITEIFRYWPTFGIKNDLLLSPMNKTWVEENLRVRLVRKIKYIEELIRKKSNVIN